MHLQKLCAKGGGWHYKVILLLLLIILGRSSARLLDLPLLCFILNRCLLTLGHRLRWVFWVTRFSLRHAMTPPHHHCCGEIYQNPNESFIADVFTLPHIAEGSLYCGCFQGWVKLPIVFLSPPPLYSTTHHCHHQQQQVLQECWGDIW